MGFDRLHFSSGRNDDRSSGTSAYKKIDFVKTEAFNRTKNNWEEEKYNKEQS